MTISNRSCPTHTSPGAHARSCGHNTPVVLQVGRYLFQHDDGGS